MIVLETVLAIVAAIIFDIIYQFQIQLILGSVRKNYFPDKYKFGPKIKSIFIILYVVPAIIIVHFRLSESWPAWLIFIFFLAIYLLYAGFVAISLGSGSNPFESWRGRRD